MSKIRIEMGDEKFEMMCSQIDRILDAGYSDSMEHRILKKFLSKYGIEMAYDVRRIES